jgi:hypothetical protein
MTSSHGPIEDKFRLDMNVLARLIDDFLNGKERPQKVGFSLHVFEFGNYEGGLVNYISNANRQDMIAATKEWLARAEGRYAESATKQ